MRSIVRSVLVLGALAGIAEAHPHIDSGPAAANKSQILTFGLSHGCTDLDGKKLDTVKLRIAIPAGVTGVRPLFSAFGKPAVIKDGTTITHVEWTKAADALLDGDDAYYELQVRAKIPDAPFTKLQFDVQQTCEDSTTHAQIVVDWNAPEGATEGEPAPLLSVVPSRTTGWNKFVTPRALTLLEIATFLGDAQIVWKGTAAFSANAITATQITATPGVTALDGLAAGDEILVTY